MMEFKTRVGEVYVLTSSVPGCSVTAYVDGGSEVTILLTGDAGQASFVAVSERVYISDPDAVVTPVSKGVFIGKAGGGGGKEWVELTGEEYRVLEESGGVDPNTIYAITEEVLAI